MPCSNGPYDVQHLIDLFGHYANGLLTEGELVGWLSEFPREIIEMLPSECPNAPTCSKPGIKEQVIKLQDDIERGDTEVIAC